MFLFFIFGLVIQEERRDFSYSNIMDLYEYKVILFKIVNKCCCKKILVVQEGVLCLFIIYMVLVQFITVNLNGFRIVLNVINVLNKNIEILLK